MGFFSFWQRSLGFSVFFISVSIVELSLREKSESKRVCIVGLYGLDTNEVLAVHLDFVVVDLEFVVVDWVDIMVGFTGLDRWIEGLGVLSFGFRPYGYVSMWNAVEDLCSVCMPPKDQKPTHTPPHPTPPVPSSYYRHLSFRVPHPLSIVFPPSKLSL
ncbi:hypothetical protein L1987_74796 [Smallanthus sonchifolius]|uniref:Uncharacterized protein n=1 Tax=Smallanthus sonchifolius TaxID=185202 RepID=A0ACB9A3J6_9ASTR|nr:hypothetical protein L1987_74796 [Smallanthus sonchifolius]